MSWKC